MGKTKKMFFKKGALNVKFWFLLIVFVLASIGFAYAEKQCANPGIVEDDGISSGDICSIIDEEEDCCPDGDEYYSDEQYYPDDQQDCEQNYFGEDLENCEITCCSFGASQECGNAAIAFCVAEGGTPDPDGEQCHATTLEGCEEGCCCYDDEAGQITTKEYCEEGLDGDFFAEIENESDCNEECEHDPGPGEGVMDPEDVEEDVEPGDDCPSDMTICPSETEHEELDGYCCCYEAMVCGPGEYCCDGSCYNTPCDDICEEHKPAIDEDTGAQKRDDDGCLLVYECLPDGSYADEKTATDDCVLGHEACYSDQDDTEDGFMNCEDPLCEGEVCAFNESHRYDEGVDDRCMGKGYYDYTDEVYKCCGDEDRLNDCTDDGTYDTCGPCDCLEVETSPILHEIIVERGSYGFDVKWSHDCEGQVDYEVRWCRENAEECPDEPDENAYSKINETTKTSYRHRVSEEDAQSDEDIKYCYYIKAKYPGSDITRSEVECFTVGDWQCMETSHDEFCLDEDLEFGSELVMKVRCKHNNTLVPEINCQTPPVNGDDTEELNRVCRGPNHLGEVECVELHPCENCGDPFRTFADYGGAETIDGVPCHQATTCFYDYSLTTRDYFRSCEQISTCHDYRSEFACENQPSAEMDSNNQCLPRDCEWEELDTGRGVCLESQSSYNTCERCEDSVYEGVFDACDFEKCSAFGDCFLRHDNQCIYGQNIICRDYQTQSQCEGGSKLDIDVEYDGNVRVGGSHEINQKSGDEMGIGLCRWNEADEFCYKDAEFSGMEDPEMRTYDYTKPETTILTSDRSRDLNISFEVNDFDGEGREGSGVEKTGIRFCKTKEGEGSCYPDELPDSFDGNRGWIDLGGGETGEHTIYYYSQDRANNLERVQSKTITIDRSKPEITIDYSVQEDGTPNYEDSKIVFDIETDKEADCRDVFNEEEGSGDLENKPMGTSWSVLYDDLSDGSYPYKVVCEDELGNEATETVVVDVFADNYIDETLPEGILDGSYDEVDLKVKTGSGAECRFGEEEKDFYEHTKTMSYDGTEGGWEVHKYHDYELDESRTYNLDVKCKNEETERISDTNIFFVYDDEPPETTLVDHHGEPIDFSDYHSEDDLMESVFVECKDYPEDYGFGCNKTYYCLEKEEVEMGCVPDEEISEEEPINLPEEEDEFSVCYYSTENTKDGYGGLEETARCDVFSLDLSPPDINLDEPLVDYNEPDNEMEVNEIFFEISGQVNDPDTIDDDNLLDITVSGENGSREYEDIPANPFFTEEIELYEGSNTISLIATDRSGQSSGPPPDEYFIYYEPYEGDRFVLHRPAFGVADSEEFTFTVKIPYAEPLDCYYGYGTTPENYNNEMESVNVDDEDGYTTQLDFSSESYVPETEYSVGVRCDFYHLPSADEIFNLMYMEDEPEIEDVGIDTGLENRDPPIIVEPPFETNLIVETDQETICKYTTDPDLGYDHSAQNYFDGYDDHNFSKINEVTLTDLEDDKDHTYYVTCENPVGEISETEAFTFRVDSDYEVLVEVLEPESPTSDGEFTLEFETTQSAEYCNIIDGPQQPDMIKIEEQVFESQSEISIDSGEHEFEVECLTPADGYQTDSFVIVVDTEPPDKPAIYTGNETINLHHMSASWEMLNESYVDVELYEYAIGSSPGETDILDWENTTDTSKQVTDLNLSEGESYYWSVRAMDELERWGEANVSDPVYTKGAEEEIDCSDYDTKENCEEQDVCQWVDEKNTCTRDEPCNTGTVSEEYNETDVDCGGPICDPCDVGENCEVDDDCVSEICEDGVCQEASCEDGRKTGAQTDVDCGGPNCPPCGIGKSCLRERDCTTGYCDNGICEDPPEEPGEQCEELSEYECGEDDDCIWNEETEECEELDCSLLDEEYCEVEENCKWDEELELCVDDVEEEEYCTADGGPMDGMLDSNCNGIPDAWIEQYPDYLSEKEERGVDDASDLDFSDDGYTNFEAYLNDRHPIDPDIEEEDPSYLFIVLMLFIMLLGLLILIYVAYFNFYDNIPPKVRHYADNVMLPVQNAVNSLLGRTSQPSKKSQPTKKPQGSRVPDQQAPPSNVVQSSGRPGGGRRGHPSQQAPPGPPTKKRAVVKDKELEDTGSTQEMIDKMRKKRQEEKQKKREQVLSKFTEEESPEKKKKNLLNKVNDTFSSEEEGKENGKNRKK